MIATFQKLFARDLNQLITEIEAYNNEQHLWLKENQVNNSAGNLALHLCGNLQHFIGHILGESDYKRNRPAEFSTRVPRSHIIAEIEKTKEAVKEALFTLTPEQLQDPFPVEVFGYEMTVSYFLIHLQGHLNYHLGQISYHRRILDV